MPNTAPVLTNLVTTVTYLESVVNATPQRLDTAVTFGDADGNFDGGIVTLGALRAQDRLATDRFGVNNEGTGAGQIGVSGSDVTYGGIVIGTISGGVGTALQVTLNAAATSAAVDALVQNLTYANVSDTPVTSHDIVLNVRDAAGADLGVVGAVTELAGASNPFDGVGSAQISFQVDPAFIDYDNDGDLDIITGGDDGQIRTFRNNGSGGFAQVTGSSNPFNGYDIGDGSGVSFIDMDGDGDRDAFITSNLDGFAVRFTNNGNGTFSNAGTISGFYRGDDQNARTAFYDVDGDGDGDAVVGGRDGTLKVWLNNSNGTFTATASHPFTSIVLPNGSFPSPTFADLDNDGDQDLLLGESNGHLLYYANQGGRFVRLADESNPFVNIAVGQNAAPTFGDMDGDGDIDLIVGSTALGLGGQLNTFRNDGVQWGQAIHVNITPVNDAPTGTDKIVTITEDAVRRFTAADFGFVDSDGNAYVGVRFSSAPIGGTLYYDADGAGEGAPVALVTFPTTTFSVADLNAGRVYFVPEADRNGIEAAVVSFSVVDNGGTTNGGLEIDPTPNTIIFDIIALNDGPVLTGFTSEAAVAASTASTPHRIDANVTLTDAEDNLAFGSLTLGRLPGTAQLFQDQFGVNNEGSGAGQIGLSGGNVTYGGVAIGTLTGGAFGTTLTVTFNGNATTAAVEALVENLTYANSSGSPLADRELILNIVDGEGAYVDLAGGFTDLGNASPFAGLGSAQLSFQVAPAFVDYDNDGDADIVTGGDDGLVRTFRNNGNGSYTQMTGGANPFNGFDFGEGSAVAFTDMNGDGLLDAFISEGLDGYGYRFTNNGNGTFSYSGLVNGFNRGSEQNGRPAAYDVDNDGDGDLVVGGRDGTLKVWINNGNGTLTATANSPFSAISFGNGNFASPTFGDFDGDGDQDLVVGLSGGTVVWYANTAGVFARVAPEDDVFAGIQVGQNASVSLGDTDGDGDLDLVVGSSKPGLAGALDVFRNDTAQGVAFHLRIVDQLAVDDAFNVNENASFSGNVTTNDDLGGAPTVTEVNGQAANVGTTIVLASGATVTVTASGTFTYNPNHAFDALAQFGTGASNQTAADSFTYTLADGNTATVVMTVRGVYSQPHRLAGTDGNDVITGTAQDDIFLASAGADQMSGGAGNDRYLVDNAGDVVIEANNNGKDTVESIVTFSLAGQFIETLKLTGSASINGTGNSLNNTLIGNGGDNVLNGAAGADEMRGGTGNDRYVVDNVGDKVLENDGQGGDTVDSSVTFSLAGQYIEVLNLTGANAINGSGNSLNNSITGNSAANTLSGAGGNDRLDGAGGADKMIGGLGNDTFIVDNAGDQITEFNGEGNDTVEASISYSLAGQYVETLKLTGTGNINATGNGQTNTLIGNSGNNTLNGGAGADQMTGGTGNDRYIVDNALDKTTELNGEGYDIVESSVTFSLAGQFLEELRLTGSAAINGSGNGNANTLVGNSAANSLNGGGGDDKLYGGLGNDTLTGGAGLDTYYFDKALGAANVDNITDFSVAEDTINLNRAIFTGLSADGTIAAGWFVTGTAAADANDRIIYNSATGNIYYDADGNGASGAVLFAHVTAGAALTNADFFAYTG